MHDFVTRLHPNDRVLLVGDTRQHEAVEAGRPFAQLQEAGMRTAKLDEIVRQRDAALKQVVEQLAKGQERQQVRLTGRELVEQHKRRWNPLNEALPEHEAKQFHWQQESGTMQSYKHVQTGRYIHIDGPAGTFHNQSREQITAKQALDYAMPEGQKHSHSLEIKPEREISISRGYGFGIGM